MTETISLTTDLEQAYFQYAVETITDRALPRVEDGLKPVQRRILYAMHDMGLRHDRPHRKSARVVGDCLGRYHPHGDQSVYLAMIRMGQDFAMRHPLVDGQGNFGSIDGDSPAAMRYTEARLSEIAGYVLQDIDQDTVDFVDNFDGSLQEPVILPAALPNLLVNGATGIAVGMATNIPPHNLGEVCDAVVCVAQRWRQRDEIGVDELLQIIPGPDFPTGGVVYRYRNGDHGEREDTIRAAYETGRGRIVTQARVDVEEIGGGKVNLVVSELPYGVQKSTLLERIAREVREGRIGGVTDLRDESDYQGMRMVIEVSRMASGQEVLESVLSRSQLRETFGVNALALVAEQVNGSEVVRPQRLSLREMLVHFIEHRLVVIVRRSRSELAKREARLHIVEGLLRALDVIDQVIETIRRSRTVETAQSNLMRELGFSEAQAQAILAMQLRRLAALERRKLIDEQKELKARIATLQELLASEARRLEVVVEETQAIKARFATPRRTAILTGQVAGEGASTEIVAEDVWVLVDRTGRVSRLTLAPPTHKALAKMGQAASLALLPASTVDDLFLFTADGRVARLPVHRLPDGKPSPCTSLCGLASDARIVAALILDDAQGGYLFLASRGGRVKRVTLEDLLAVRSVATVMGLNGDELVGALPTAGEQELLLVTRQGKAIRFSEEEVRAMGLTAGGVAGIRLSAGDQVVAGDLAQDGAELVTVSEQGYGKRTDLSEFPTQGRGGSGVVAAKTSARTGPLIGAAVAGSKDALLVVTARGRARAMSTRDVTAAGRATQGGLVITLGEGDVLATAQTVMSLTAREAPE